MLKILILLLLISVTLTVMYFGFALPVNNINKTLPTKNAHLYNDKSVSIKNIVLTAIYFVPKDRQENMLNEWQSKLTESLDHLARFHLLQTKGESSITVNVYNKPIIGIKSHDEYKSGKIHGSQIKQPSGIVSNEVNSRKDEWDGVFLQNKLNNNSEDVFNVTLVLFEGDGASGVRSFVLLSSEYFRAHRFSDIRDTILAHEFYHGLDLPDNYDTTTAVYNEDTRVDRSLVRSLDIMGQGATRMLDDTYISRDFLSKMGV